MRRGGIFGKIYEEIRANSEKIRAKQKEKKCVQKHKITRAHYATYARIYSHTEY